MTDDDQIPDAFKRYRRKKGGPDATLLTLDSGGEMIILTEGKPSQDHAQLRCWLKAEVLEYKEMMTLEYVLEHKEREQ